MAPSILNDHVIYRCVIGSRAYGLEHEASDTDRRGVYLPPAELHWSLQGVPEQVENDVAKPIENAVNTVAGIKRLLSASYEGLGFTWIEFKLDVDQDRVLQEVRDKVAQIRAGFPREVKDPVVQRGGDENDEPVAFYALVGERLSARQLTTLLSRARPLGNVVYELICSVRSQLHEDAGSIYEKGKPHDGIVNAREGLLSPREPVERLDASVAAEVGVWSTPTRLPVAQWCHGCRRGRRDLR